MTTTTDADRVIITSTFDLDETPGTGYVFTYRGVEYRAEWWHTHNSSGLDFYDADGRAPADPFPEPDEADDDWDSHSPFEFARDRLEAFYAVEFATPQVIAAEAAVRAAEARALRLAAGDTDEPAQEVVTAAWGRRVQSQIDTDAFATDEERFGPQVGEHVFLVAVSIETDADREAAEHHLHRLLQTTQGQSGLTWWIAEDERHDRSDNDSAVFVHPGRQTEAALLLRQAGLAR